MYSPGDSTLRVGIYFKGKHVLIFGMIKKNSRPQQVLSGCFYSPSRHLLSGCFYSLGRHVLYGKAFTFRVVMYSYLV